MNNKKILSIIVLGFVLLMVGASLLYTKLSDSLTPDQLAAQETPPQEEQAQTDAQEQAQKPEPVLAPDFTVYDREGNEVHLSDYVGKPIVLNFWASWCGPCQMEMPGFHEKYLELGEEVHFLMINATIGRETLESAMDFVDKSGYTFPVFYDTQADAAMAYGAYSLPTTYFIDADGYAITRANGAIDAEMLQLGIDIILPQK